MPMQGAPGAMIGNVIGSCRTGAGGQRRPAAGQAGEHKRKGPDALAPGPSYASGIGQAAISTGTGVRIR